MSDYLTRIAALAVQAPAIVPRIAARFERGLASDAGDGASLREIEEWVEAPRPASTPERAHRTTAQASPTATEAGVDRTAPHVDAAPTRSAQLHEVADAQVVPSAVTLDVRGIPALDALASAVPVDATAEVARTDVEAPQPMPAPGASPAAQPPAASDDPPAIGHVLRLDVSQVVQAAEPATSAHAQAPRRAPLHAGEPPRAGERAAPAPGVPPPLQVEINIDRIEVRAMTPAAPLPAMPAAPARAPMSLDEHLRRRRGEPA